MGRRSRLVMTMDPLFILLALIASGLGAYLGSYLKKKGENLATHEDIDKLVAQVTAVTQATKEIEATISVDVWDRQKQWEIKRDAFLEAVKELVTVEDALTDLHSASENVRSRSNSENASIINETLQNQKLGANKRWRDAILSFRKARELATLVSDEDLGETFDIVCESLILIGRDLMDDKPVDYTGLGPEIDHLRAAIRQGTRNPYDPGEGATMKILAERIVKMAIFAYRMHPHDLDLQIVCSISRVISMSTIFS